MCGFSWTSAFAGFSIVWVLLGALVVAGFILNAWDAEEIDENEFV